ncbi:MAG: hypothetical protein KDJ52_06355 [Anaerolineae bacterium]|nr:hypothetical protein [Anaerolineae bacterium]
MGTHKLKYLLFMMISLVLAGFISETRTAKAAANTFTIKNLHITENAVSIEDPLGMKSEANPKANTPSDNNEGAFVSSEVLTVTKVAIPTSVPETGGVVTFTITVTSDVDTPLDSLSILEDSEFGDLDQQGDCEIPVSPFHQLYTCNFTKTLTGSSTASHQNTVTATTTIVGIPEETDTDTATVDFTDVTPDITVQKNNDANDDNVFTDNEQALEGGVSVPFKVTITNNTAEEVTIDEIIDDTHDLTSSDCETKEGTTLAGNTSINCLFFGTIPDDDDITETNVVTVTVFDDENNFVSDSDTSTVTTYDIQPNITVSKKASPTEVPESGGDVTFTISVTNNSTETVTLTSLTDTVFGNLNGQGTCATGGDIGANLKYTCQITKPISGNFNGPAHHNTVTAVVQDDDGNSDNDNNGATVSFTNEPSSIEVSKTANPTSVFEPGDDVTFTVVATNTSNVDYVTINSVSDDVFNPISNLNCTPSLPAFLAPNDKITCTFTEFVAGNGGDTHTNTVTVSGEDDDGDDVSGTDSATVEIIDIVGEISVNLTPDTTSIDEPGGSINFTVTINNLSTSDSVTIDTLTDTFSGNLSGKGTCATLSININASSQYQCTYSAPVSGNAGQVKKNTLNASGKDADNAIVSDSDVSTVTITDVPSSINVTKTANPSSLPEPGGSVKFTLVVKNTSPVDTVTINSLTDNLFGNLNGKGCTVPQTLTPGKQYQCSFTGDVSGTAGQSKTSTTTVAAKDDDDVTLNKIGSATVTIGAKDTFYTYVPILTKPTPVLLSVQNDKTGGNVIFTVIGAGVSCTVPNNQTKFCGSFAPGTYNVKAESLCGTATAQKTYTSGSQTTRIFCQ